VTPCRPPQGRNPGKGANQLLCHAVGKEFLRSITGKIIEWEHDQGVNWRRGLRRMGRLTFNKPNKTIPALRKSFDVARLIGVVPQSSPQFVDCLVQASFEIDKCIRGPELFAELFPRHHLARTFQKQHQRLERLILQVDLVAIPAQFAGSSIQLEQTESDSRRRRMCHFDDNLISPDFDSPPRRLANSPQSHEFRGDSREQRGDVEGMRRPLRAGVAKPIVAIDPRRSPCKRNGF
jgi:hypothetical protein